MQEFFESPPGIASAVIVCAVSLLILGGALRKNKRLSMRTLTCSGVAIALSVALSYVQIEMPQGGSITPCSMMFISLIGYWFGPAAGIIAGVADGFMQFIIKPYAVHPLQIFLDYPLAFGALGLAGFFINGKHRLQFGIAAGALGRWFMSFIAGIVFYAEYAGDQNPVIYSAVYNISYILPELILSLVIISIPSVRAAVDVIPRGEPARSGA